MVPPNKQKYVIASSANLRDALALIEENRHRSLIVVSDRGAVVGTLSDGDARKALLKGHLLVTPVSDVMNTNFIALRDTERAQAKDIFSKTHIFLIPVIDEKAELIDVIESYS
jgi:CBS domain-containing protein